jgi:hypothetical protein
LPAEVLVDAATISDLQNQYLDRVALAVLDECGDV